MNIKTQWDIRARAAGLKKKKITSETVRKPCKNPNTESLTSPRHWGTWQEQGFTITCN